MLARPLRTKRKSASAQRYLRSLGATIDMANLIMRPSKGSSQRRIIVWMFTKSQLGGRCGYWVWSPSGNCCQYTISPVDLLAFLIGTAGVTDRDFKDVRASLGQLDRQLGLDAEVS